MKKNLTNFLIFLIRIYQKKISPLFPPCCRFYPTCSAYTIEALTKFGFFKGSYLSIKRILKCNPFFKGGVDKVPDEFYFFHKNSSEIKQKY